MPVEDAISNQARKELVDAGQIDSLAGLISSTWNQWLNLLAGQLNKAPFIQNGVSLTAQGASVGATDFTGGALSGGLYRLTYYVQVTRAATTSSSIQPVLSWTYNGGTVSFSVAALTGNTVTTGDSQTKTVLIDAGSPVTYALNYASVGGTSMLYSFSVAIEQMPV